MIELTFNNRTKSRALSRASLEHICDVAAPFLRIPRGHDAEVGITLLSSAAMRRLNKTRRRIDKATDVLSFPLHMEPVKGYTAVFLGDIFICPDVVRAHTQESGLSVREQMSWTVAHGLLHLAGYDHEKSRAEAVRMAGLEMKILKRLNR